MSDDNQDRERALRERIVSLMRANEQARRKSVPEDEVQRLKAAASRLDQMLKAGAEQEAENLKNAAARLDRFLADMRKGKDFTEGIRRRKAKE